MHTYIYIYKIAVHIIICRFESTLLLKYAINVSNSGQIMKKTLSNNMSKKKVHMKGRQRSKFNI